MEGARPDSAGRRRASPAATVRMTSASTEVAVIGAGIVGLATTYALRQSGVEVSCSPTIVRDADFARETFGRIAVRYLGEAGARAYVDRFNAGGESVVVIRLVPGQLRTWDFADDELLSEAG